MYKINRRNAFGISAAYALSATAYTRVAHAVTKQPKVSLGFVGCGGRAKSLVKGFENTAEIRWACDPDRKRLNKFQEFCKASLKTSTDLRRLLDDKSLDAIVIATPDHWHAPAAIMACEAKKHVYVEKPCSHNLREGEWLVAAARRNRCVVQHGTQSRSHREIAGAMELIQEGIIGDVLMCKAWNVQRRRNIGTAQPASPPDHVDYDTWVGPAEFMPFQSNRFHYDWHWWHNFGTGDIGNDGTHEIDIARWGLGVSGPPSTVSAVGGKFYFLDDQQFPDTATCVFQWPGDNEVDGRKQLIFEMRIWSKNYPHNVDTGVEFYGTKGMMFVSKRGKFSLWNESNQPQRDFSPKSETVQENHQVDFLNAIQDSRPPRADIAIGHDSSSLVHLANASLLAGKSLQVIASESADKEGSVQIEGDEDVSLGRTYRRSGHWAIPKQA